MGELSSLERIAELEARVAALESATADVVARIMQAIDIPHIPAQLFALLLKRRYVSAEAAWAVIYGMRGADEIPDAAVLKVHLCRLRRFIEPVGGEIVTVRAGRDSGPLGGGWYLRDREILAKRILAA